MKCLAAVLGVLLSAAAMAQQPNALKVCVVPVWNVEDDVCTQYLDCGAFLITGTTSPGRGQLVWCNDADSKIDYIGPTRTTTGGVYSFGASGAPNYTQSFTAKTSVILTHGLGTDNLIIQCHGSDDNILGPDSVSYARSTPFDATVTFASSQSGRCIVNGLQNAGKHTATFTSQTTVTVLGTAHALGTTSISVDCYDNAAPFVRFEPDRVTIAAITNDVVITFLESESGKCVLQ